MKNLLIAQSGGPTAAINATLVGVLKAAVISEKVDKIYGALNGIQGVLTERLVELNYLANDDKKLKELAYTPSSALGSCRYKLEKSSQQIQEVIHILRKHNIGYFVYIGGNDSMDTVYKLSKYCEEQGIDDIHIVGAPKTIDNDLEQIDHCPGFGSAAKYVAITFAELERDISVYDIKAVTIVEVMGRNTGWLTAASALSRLNGNRGPNLIYLCERDFDDDRFISDVKDRLTEHNSIIVAVSEGVKYKDGDYVSNKVKSRVKDVFGHLYLGGAARYLEELVKEKIGCKTRSIELSLMQRCSGHVASNTDITEAWSLGMNAGLYVLEGKNGQMASLKRIKGSKYKVEFLSVPIEKVANKEKKVPLNWINEEGNYITDDMIEYLYPLIQGEVKIAYINGIPKQVVL